MSRHQPTEENIYAAGAMLLINKPIHWTSFDVVKKIRSLCKAKVGHAGTLDPLATGLLICCTGKLTKQIPLYQQQEKEYTGTFTLGAVTPTYDLESAPEDFRDLSHLNLEDIGQTTQEFIGNQLQIPPQHSAIKKNGKPLYEFARKGIEVEVEPRKIFIGTFEITRMILPEVDFRVVCSTGTYIRSLAHDFGDALGTGAYLSRLCRTRIGDFQVEDALDMEQCAETIRANLLRTDSPPQN